jgi:hypothetical protein
LTRRKKITLASCPERRALLHGPRAMRGDIAKLLT